MRDNLGFEASRIERDEDEGNMAIVAYALLASFAAIAGLVVGAVYVGWSWL